MKNKYRFSLLCLILSVAIAGAEEKHSSAGSRTNLARDLSLKLADLDSFQAEYKAVAPDKSADITLLFNKEKKYCLCRLAMAVPDQEDVYTVLDFSQMNGKCGGFDMLIATGTKGRRFRLSFQDMFERLDNPVGVLCFMAKQFAAETKANTDKIDVEPGAPSLSLGLSAESLVLGMGITSKSKHITASWLDVETITNAVKILESSDSIQFSYADDHVVLIDKKTGLLVKDTWPDPSKPGPRNIALAKHSVLKRNAPYSSLIPGFHSIEFEQLTPEHLYKQMYVSFLTDLGHKLSEMDGFDETLERHSADIAAAVRKLGRAMIREDAKKMVNNDKAKEFAEEFLRPSYEQYTAKHAQKANGISFPDFLSNLMRAAEADPNALMSPGARKFTETIKKECETVLDELPEDAQTPLKKLYDENMSALVEGWILEFLSATLDQVKTLELEEDKNVPNKSMNHDKQ